MSSWTGWEEFKAPLLDSSLNPMGTDRPPGLHLSDVIRAMKQAAGEKLEGPEGEQEGLRMLEGFLWETAVEYILAGMTHDQAMEAAFRRYMLHVRRGMVRQVRLEQDGIKMTPDAFDPAEGRLESYKHTRRSLKNALTIESFSESFWTWFVQEQSYCLAAGVDSVRWIVLWAAGDYGKGPGTGPQALECTVTFTPDELLTNWHKVVLKHAEGLR